MSALTTGLVALALLGTSPADARTAVPASSCTAQYSVQDFKHYASRVYRREEITRKARKQIVRMRRCQADPADQTAVKRLRKKYKRHRIARIKRARAAYVREYRVGYVLPWRIVRCESGGNWKAVNTSNPNRPAGAYQIITSTWLGAGGGRFAPTADAATPRQQNIVVLRIWRGGAGAGQWECK